MLGQGVASLSIRHFCSIDLLINSPGERLIYQVLQVSHSGDECCILGVVREHHADVMLFGEVLEEVKELLDQLEVLLLLVGDHVE